MRRQFDLIRQGGRVQRFHAKPVVLQENVAEHSFYVAWVVWMYGAEVSKPPSAQLLMACLQHDLAEAVTGDMPGPTKRALGREAFAAYEAEVLSDHHMVDFATLLTEGERELLKFGDNLAGYMKALQETQMGNRYMIKSQRNYLAYLQDSMANSKALDPVVMKRMIDLIEGETDVH